MTKTSLPYSNSNMFNEIENLRVSTNSTTILVKLLTFALQLILNIDYAGYRIREGVFRSNGYRTKVWTLPIGTLTLSIPCPRKGYYRPFFEDRLDEATSAYLDHFLFEAYSLTGSLRDIERMLPALNYPAIKKSQIGERIKKYTDKIAREYQKREITEYYPILYVDALYENILYERKYRKLAVVVIYGIRLDGKSAEILHVFPVLNESESTYMRAFEDLKQIGLLNPMLLITDCHLGLRAAIKDSFPGAGWQRCAVHLCRAVFRKLPKKLKTEDRKAFVCAVKRVFFDSESKEEALEWAKQTIETYEEVYREAIEIFRAGYRDSLCFYDFEDLDYRLTRTTNPIERLNRRIRKRTKRSGQYPGTQAYLRQVLTYLFEHVEETLDKEYFQENCLHRCLQKHQALLATLPERVKKVLEEFQTKDSLEVKSLSTPSKTDSTVFITLTDKTDPANLEEGMVQIAQKSFVCTLEEKRISIRSQAVVYIDRIGRAHCSALVLSAEDSAHLPAKLAKTFRQEKIRPILLCSDTLDESEYSSFQKMLPKTLIQSDFESILERCVCMVPKGDREKTRKRIKSILTASKTQQEVETELKDFWQAFRDRHPEAGQYLSSQMNKLTACFKIQNNQPPARQMMSVTQAEAILKLTQDELKKSEDIDFETLVRILFQSCQQMTRKWSESKRSVINPIRFLPGRKL